MTASISTILPPVRLGATTAIVNEQLARHIHVAVSYHVKAHGPIIARDDVFSGNLEAEEKVFRLVFLPRCVTASLQSAGSKLCVNIFKCAYIRFFPCSFNIHCPQKIDQNSLNFGCVEWG